MPIRPNKRNAVKDVDNLRPYFASGGTASPVVATTTGGAPLNAEYVTMSADGNLTAEHVLAGGSGISLVDGGSTATLNINWATTGLSSIEPDDAGSYGSESTTPRADHQHAIVAAAPEANSVSLSASAEGSGSSFARADHTHNLDESIVPSWTGIHTFINEGLHLLDTNASHDLVVKPGSDLTADRIFTLTTGDAARTLDLGGNLAIGATTSITGGGTLALGGFTLTVPATGTAALLGTANVFTALNTFDLGISIKSRNELRWYDNGNYVGFEAPALAANQIWTLPPGDGDEFDFLVTDGAGGLSWMSFNGTVSTSFTINTGAQDVDVQLRLERTTGGPAVFTWNGDIMQFDEPFKPSALIVNEILAGAPANTWAGQLWLEP